MEQRSPILETGSVAVAALAALEAMALRQTWSRSQLQAMLRNPKYTGSNVWGRHDKRRGRPFQRPREQWFWSPVAVHEPIVPKSS